MGAKSAKNTVSCVLEIDSSDCIVSRSDGWDSFALENFGSELRWEFIRGSVFWDLIEDASEADVYRRLVSEARKGRIVKFKFRCESTAVPTLFGMTIEQTANGRVGFSTRVIRTRTRSISDLGSGINHTSPLLVCSWCGRLKVEGKKWQRIDIAVNRIGLFENRPMPPISHGICGRCLKDFSGELQE